MFTNLSSYVGIKSGHSKVVFDADAAFLNLSLLDQEISSLQLLTQAIESGADINKLMTSTALRSSGPLLFGPECATFDKDQFLDKLHDVRNMGDALQIALCTKVLSKLGADTQSVAALEDLSSTPNDDSAEASEIPTKKSLIRRYLRLLSSCVVLLGIIGLLIHKNNERRKADERALREYRQRREDAEKQREAEIKDEQIKRQKKRAEDRFAQERADREALNKIREREYEKDRARYKAEYDKYAYQLDRIPGSISPADLHDLGMKISFLDTFQNTIVSAIRLGGPLIDLKNPEKALTDIKRMEALIEDSLRLAKRSVKDVGDKLGVVAQNRGPTQKEIDENALEKAEAYTKHQKEKMLQTTKDLSAVSAKMLAEYAKHSFIPESFKNTLKNIHDHAEKLLSSSSVMDTTIVTTKQIGH